MDTVHVEPIEEFKYDLKIKFEPFYVQVKSDQEVVKLPDLFNQQHSHQIARIVMVCDPAGNMHQIGVDVRNCEAYFTMGWSRIANFYDIPSGGWARLVFIAADMFLIQLTDRLDNPVKYPLPAQINLLCHPPKIVEYPRSDIVPYHYAAISKKPGYFHTVKKVLSAADLTSGFLIAFHESGMKSVVFDEYGHQCTCVVDFNTKHPSLAGITSGWKQFCSVKLYCEGLHIEIAVPVGNPRIISVVVMNM